MEKEFRLILDNYLKLKGNKVDSDTDVYKSLCKRIPKELREIINDDKYVVKGSMGQGQRSSYPWISILDRNITTTTQKGLYIVFLFKKDMSGVYLTLNQGITNFENLYGKDKYAYAKRVADYFKNEISDTTFSKNPINIGGELKDLGYGYEQTNVLQKYYSKKDINDELLIKDIKELLNVYTDISSLMATQSYDEVIKNVLADGLVSDIEVEYAIEEIKKAVDPDNETPYGFSRKLQEVSPKSERPTKFRRITNPRRNKIDHIKKQEKDSKAGLLGEELVLSYERDRLVLLGLEEYADKIVWVSDSDDSAGFDIKSYDLDSKGKVKEIKIEVKTSREKVDVDFFVSKNEVEKSKLYADHYYVYRIYDVYSEHPKFYRVLGKIEDNFILDPYTYTARYKNA